VTGLAPVAQLGQNAVVNRILRFHESIEIEEVVHLEILLRPGEGGATSRDAASRMRE
jgi:hypothetical protein